MFARRFKDRRALTAFIGLSGMPYDSGSSRREQGISKNGNPRVRRLLGQLSWRWLNLQPQSVPYGFTNASTAPRGRSRMS
ncbi:IS110 family transposase [Methylocystis sp. H4A]|nr:IS110 family transposase [Methylocystis sp. H4A]